MTNNGPILNLHPLVRLLRLFLWLSFLFFLVFGSLALALRTETAQSKIVHWLAKKASEKLGYQCSIGAFYLDWVDFARVRNVMVKDKEGHKMIFVKEIKINLKLAALLEKNINLDFVELQEGLVEIRRSRKTGKLNFNGFTDAIIDWVEGSDSSRSLNPPIFTIDKSKLNAMSFAYIDELEAPLPGQFDYYHFRLDGINGLVNKFWQRRDSIRLEADGLVCIDRASRLKVKSFNTLFGFTKRDMFFRHLKAEIGNSLLRDSLSFQFKDLDDFSDFNRKVEIGASLDSSVIRAEDLAYFAPALRDWHESYTVSGNLSGRVNNFRWRKMKIFSGKSTLLTGTLNMRGLPETDETFMDLRLKPSVVNPSDLAFYTGKEASEYLGMLGVFDVSGSFTGFFRDFVTKSTFKTKLGTINADMQMELPEGDLQQSRYNGRLKTVAFNLGRLLKQEDKIQKIDFDGSFQGKGLDPKRAEASVKAKISRIGLLGYDYRNIATDASFSRRSFNGNLSVKDPHLIFNGHGKLDLSKGLEVVDIDALVGRANFMPLKLTKEPLDISSEVSLHFKGFDFDEFLGNAEVRNLRVLLRDERMDLDQASVESHIVKGNKTFSLKTPLVDATIQGSFKYRKLIEDALAMVKEYQRLLKNDGLVNMEAFVAQRKKSAVDYGVETHVVLKDLNRLLDLLDLPVSVSEGTAIDAKVQFGKSEMISLQTKIDSFTIAGRSFYETDLDVNATKTLERPDVTAELYVFSKGQKWTEGFITEKLLFDGVWDKGKIGFKIKGNEKGQSNRADIFGDVVFEPFNTLVSVRNSSINFLNRIWNFSSDNAIVFSDTGSISFRDMEVRNGLQSLSVSGTLLGSKADSVIIKASEIDLASLRTLIGEEIEGLVTGEVKISNIGDSPLFAGFLSATALKFRKYGIGDFKGNAIWNQEQKNLQINGSLLRDGAELLFLSGFYSPEMRNPLDLRAKVFRVGIDFLQPLIGNSVSNMKGWASGDLNITGNFSKPELNGTLYVKDGQVKINYLNTTYFFNPKVVFTPDEISADGALITDEAGQNGILRKATLRHNNFSDFLVDLNADLTNFMVFNVPKSAGDVYYGTGICTGNLEIIGGFDDIGIRAKAKTNKGTKLFIPLDVASKEDIGESYITFTGKKEKRVFTRTDSVRNIRLSGIRMDFDLDVTEEAYGEIIFDQKAGDIIRANGTGKIKLTIDTRGEFSVIGQYVIKNGDYHFTTYNLVNKDFDIRPGSTITWNGPVLGGVMDILAEYNLNASLAPLASADEQIQQKPEAKRRYPVLVSMRLTDQLLKPTISLGLEIRDYPKNSDLNYYVQAFLTRIATDEQELNRQVFSLMIFRMFAPMGEFTQTANISYSSFSDLVSNQLSSWLSQFDENLEVSVDLAGLSQSALNNFQLRFSYTMLDGRLRLTRDGGFTNAQNQTSALSIAGDWTLEYMLSKNGIFRVKMFHKMNQNLILSGLSNNNTTQGASLLHTQSFNKLGELFPKKKKQETKKPEPARKPEESPESAATIPEQKGRP